MRNYRKFILLLVVPQILKPPSTYGFCKAALKKRLKAEGKAELLKMRFFSEEEWKSLG